MPPQDPARCAASGAGLPARFGVLQAESPLIRLTSAGPLDSDANDAARWAYDCICLQIRAPAAGSRGGGQQAHWHEKTQRR